MKISITQSKLINVQGKELDFYKFVISKREEENHKYRAHVRQVFIKTKNL